MSQERALPASGGGSKHGPPVGGCGDPTDPCTPKKVPSGFKRVPNLPRSGSARPEQRVGYPWSLHLHTYFSKRGKIRPWGRDLERTNWPPRAKPTVGGRPGGTKPEAARVCVFGMAHWTPLAVGPRGPVPRDPETEKVAPQRRKRDLRVAPARRSCPWGPWGAPQRDVHGPGARGACPRGVTRGAFPGSGAKQPWCGHRRTWTHRAWPRPHSQPITRGLSPECGPRARHPTPRHHRPVH